MLMQQGYGILQRLNFNKGYKSQKMATVDFEQNAAHEFQEVESWPWEFQQRFHCKTLAGSVGLSAGYCDLTLNNFGFPYIFMIRTKTWLYKKVSRLCVSIGKQHNISYLKLWGELSLQTLWLGFSFKLLVLGPGRQYWIKCPKFHPAQRFQREFMRLSFRIKSYKTLKLVSELQRYWR